MRQKKQQKSTFLVRNRIPVSVQQFAFSFMHCICMGRHHYQWTFGWTNPLIEQNSNIHNVCVCVYFRVFWENVINQPLVARPQRPAAAAQTCTHTHTGFTDDSDRTWRSLRQVTHSRCVQLTFTSASGAYGIAKSFDH